ncbi:MAG: hypothetical protein N2312_04175 [Dictyoglomaceae bacterium]|nr:hypothetical protein [Dictyoglomaceae bacterium]
MKKRKSFKEILLRKKKREEQLKTALFNILKELKKLGALKIILFGLLAHGDVDVIVT